MLVGFGSMRLRLSAITPSLSRQGLERLSTYSSVVVAARGCKVTPIRAAAVRVALAAAVVLLLVLVVLVVEAVLVMETVRQGILVRQARVEH